MLLPSGVMAARFKDICLDAIDNALIADWWCRALDYVRRDPDVAPHEPICIVDPEGAGPPIWFSEVPEPKTVKNRMHFDVVGVTDDLLALGAILVRAEDGDIGWDILADPEGNEFCVFSPQ
jgi:Glyoxalase-like domain